ncbi:MAG: DUF4411 family protein [Planctomycetota bacterium]
MTDGIVVLDADSLIRAKREHYAFDFCPGYWEALLKLHGAGRLESIDRVRSELTKGAKPDALAAWVTAKVPATFFSRSDATAVVAVQADIANAVQSSGQYKQPAKARFLRGADPWLIAYATANGRTLATYEVAQPTSVSKIKIPDMAKTFGVKCVAPYTLLRGSGYRLVLG